MITLTITHTAADGTLIEGTSRGDGSGDVLKRNGWRWSRNLGSWFVPRSRDQRPKRHVIDATRAQLSEAGFDVDVEIDEQARPTADVVADTRTRAAARAERFDDIATRAQERSDALHERAREKASHIPLGQPILIGHHSEGRDRRFRASINRDDDRSREAAEEARAAAHRADTARATAREDHPVTVANRINRLEAERRRLERSRQGSTDETYREAVSHELDVFDERIAYWQGVRDEQIRDGRAGQHSRDTIAAGDAVLIRGQWHIVQRANPKSVTVHGTPGMINRAPYEHISGHRPANEEVDR